MDYTSHIVIFTNFANLFSNDLLLSYSLNIKTL